MNENTPLMVDPRQMVDVSRNNSSLATMYMAIDIANAWGSQYENHDGFNTLCLYTFLFEIGRMQGIREERAKRHTRPHL